MDKSKTKVQRGSAASHSTRCTTRSTFTREKPHRRFIGSERNKFHYVLRMESRYWPAEGDVLTPHLHKALFLDSYDQAGKLGALFSEQHRPIAWPEPLRIERILTNSFGLVIGSEPFPSPNEPDNWSWSWHNDQQHTLALAAAATFETERDPSGETLHFHSTLLTQSPLWAGFHRQYLAELETEQTEIAIGRNELAGHAIQWLAARLFFAGVCAGRNEAGRRNRFGRLLLDDPGSSEARTDD